LPNFEGLAYKLNFPASHESNFAAYFTGRQIFGPENSAKVGFGPKVDFKYHFFDFK